MSAYIGGIGSVGLAQSRTFLLIGSFLLLLVAVYLNLIGLRIGNGEYPAALDAGRAADLPFRSSPPPTPSPYLSRGGGRPPSCSMT